MLFLFFAATYELLKILGKKLDIEEILIQK